MNETEANSRAKDVAFDCAVCGDGEIMPGREECDDSNRLPDDGNAYRYMYVPMPCVCLRLGLYLFWVPACACVGTCFTCNFLSARSLIFMVDSEACSLLIWPMVQTCIASS